MEKSLLEYDKNLEDLERQREKLEIVMQRMGQEWEESGAGVGWLGSLDLPATSQEIEIPSSPILSINDIHVPEFSTNATTATLTTAITTEALTDGNISQNTLSSPLFSNILSNSSGPSPEYLQSLLNVNEALLAQSLANTTPMLTPIDERLHEPMLITEDETVKAPSLLMTPQDTPDQKEVNPVQQDYILTSTTVEPETEVIFSPLAENIKITNFTSITNNNNDNNNNNNKNNNNDQDPIQL